MGKIGSALELYRDEGVRSVFEGFHSRLVKPRLVSRRLAIGTDEVTELAGSRVRVSGGGEKEIRYDGMFQDSVPDPIERILGTVPVRDCFCWRFTDADVFGPDVYLGVDGRYVVPTSVGWDEKDGFWRRELAARLPYLGSPSRSETTEVGSVFVLSDRFRFETNFGMWYYETLPKPGHVRRILREDPGTRANARHSRTDGPAGPIAGYLGLRGPTRARGRTSARGRGDPPDTDRVVSDESVRHAAVERPVGAGRARLRGLAERSVRRPRVRLAGGRRLPVRRQRGLR